MAVPTQITLKFDPCYLTSKSPNSMKLSTQSGAGVEIAWSWTLFQAIPKVVSALLSSPSPLSFPPLFFPSLSSWRCRRGIAAPPPLCGGRAPDQLPLRSRIVHLQSRPRSRPLQSCILYVRFPTDGKTIWGLDSMGVYCTTSWFLSCSISCPLLP